MGFSLLTVFLALIVGGLAMAFTGANPLSVYKDLIVGAGFDWPFHLIPGNPLGVEPLLAENNLVSTLVQFTPLVLTGLAVAFAFRCGLFNIGGTGQFWVGSVCALLVAQRVGGPTGMIAATLAAGIGGAIWAGLAGGLKAYRGAHEVITTIMLNWIAIYTTQYLFAVSGPLTDKSVGNGVSKTIESRRSIRGCGASSRRSTSGSSSRSAAPSSTTWSSIARRSATRCAPWASMPKRPATAASPSSAR